MNNEKFNYVIGFYWHKDHVKTQGRIGCYMFHGTEVLFGTMEDAQDSLNYVRQKYDPAENTDTHFHDYKIFKLLEITT